MKYKLLKILDVSGFTFLSPVVRLCSGEEPKKQLGEIGRYIVVPIVACVLFFWMWGYLAPKHKTKSGEVPTPRVVWDAATGIWSFHSREGEKSLAYELSGEGREGQLKLAEARLEELEPLAEEADRQVVEAEAASEEKIQEALAPLEKLRNTKEELFSKRQEQRVSKLKKIARKLPKDDIDLRKAYLGKVKEHLVLKDEEREEIKVLRSKEDAIRSEKFPKLDMARKAQTAIAEERQHLTKLTEQLTKNNRSVKLAQSTAGLKEELKAFYTASNGEEAYQAALRVEKTKERIEKTADSEYAKPWTLPDQVIRSLACVFFGFVLGSAIAIPIGVLCGLSDTFMAAMTPFIAFFKPVSPIVWLPISLIIVGGFIPDPDKNTLMIMLAELPLIGWMKINPAFIASGVTVALCSLWPTLVNTALGVASIDKDHVNVARVLRLGFWSRLIKIVVPSSLPLIFAGLRISLGVGWMVLIAAELLSSSEGIGKKVWDEFNNGASDSFAKMFVVVFVVGAIGFLLDRIMIVFQRMVSFDGAPAAV